MTFYPATFATIRGVRFFYLGTFATGAFAGVIAGVATVMLLAA
jgi:hypothetical protein